MATKNLFEEKKKLIQKITDELERSFGNLSDNISRKIIDDFIDRLDRKGDQIINNSKNLQLIAVIDKLYTALFTQHGSDIVNTIIKNVAQINKLNVDYFSEFGGEHFQSSAKKVQQIIRDRLGIGDKVQLKEGGYLDSLLKDTRVKNDIKRISYQEVLKGGGFKNFKEGLRKYIVGDKDKVGAFEQHYRQYAYDIYVQVDRDESLLMANEVDLSHFIYEGTLIDTSRPFCIERAGKVFTIEEAQEWVHDDWIKRNLEKGYITSYNPITDMGLFGCRHIPRFISKEVAERLRPDLKK
jgi:hypothetical protein